MREIVHEESRVNTAALLGLDTRPDALTGLLCCHQEV